MFRPSGRWREIGSAPGVFRPLFRLCSDIAIMRLANRVQEKAVTEYVFTWLYRQDPFLDNDAFRRWSVADNWISGEWNGPGPYDPNAPERNILTNVGLGHRAPGPDDTVVFGKPPPYLGGYASPGFVGGGSAARLLVNTDASAPVNLGGGTFGAVEIHGVMTVNTILNAQHTHIDEGSSLIVGGTAIDERGRRYSASLGELTIEETGSLVVGAGPVNVASVQGDTTPHPRAAYFNPTGPLGGIYADLELYPEPLQYQPAQGAEYGRVVLGAESHAAQVLRLYGAALDRLPDQAGLDFWTDAARDGRPLPALAGDFLGSAEFSARFGDAADNGAFVDRLYQNVLGRAGEADGRGFWAAALDKGAARAEVLAAFSESAESKAATAVLGQRGVWIKGQDAAQLTRLYDTLLDRLPDAKSFVIWKDEFGSGRLSLGDNPDELIASAEFRAGHNGLDDAGFARLLAVLPWRIGLHVTERRRCPESERNARVLRTKALRPRDNS